jgi:hypothetical protein
MPSGTLCVLFLSDVAGTKCRRRSVEDGIPTRSMGTRERAFALTPSSEEPHSRDDKRFAFR